MRTFLIAASVLILGGATLLTAQNAPASSNPVMGRGRGGAPYARNDKNKDGICDLTGAPVGQGRGAGAMRCGRKGRGMGAAWGRGAGRGMGQGFLRQQQPQQQAAPTPQK
jgi:hypothetical protein